MRNLLVKMLLMFVLTLGIGLAFADVITIGTGTSYVYEPIASYYGYHRSATIYKLGEVNGTGTVTSVAYKAYNTVSTTIPIKIYMKMTTAVTLSPAVTWGTLTTGATLVYDGSFSGTTAGAWKTINLTTPYVYTANNLEILVESNYGGGGTSGPQWYYSTAANLNQYIRKDTTAPTTETGTVNSSRPNVQLTITGYTPLPTPPAAVIGAPADLATGIGLTPTLSWSAGSGNATDGYRLYFGTDGSGTTRPTTLVNNVNQGTSTSYTHGTALTASTTYYWCVVPFNANGDASVTPIWRFTTGTQLTANVTLGAPADVATNVAPYTKLTWSSLSGASSYDVYFGTTSPGDLVANVTTTSYAPAMAYGATYYWKVVGRNGVGPSTGTPTVRSFSIWADPTVSDYPYTQGFDAATLPLGWSSYISTGSGTYLWTPTGTGTNPTAAPHSGGYMLMNQTYSQTSGTIAALVSPPLTIPGDNYRMSFWMYRDNASTTSYPNEGVKVYLSSTLADTTSSTMMGYIHRRIIGSPVEAVAGWYKYTYEFGAAASGTTKYVIFNAFSDYGYNTFIDDVTFEKIPQTPEAAISPSPVNAATLIGPSQTFTWAAGNGAAPNGFKVFLGTDNPPTDILPGVDVGSDTTFPFEGPLHPGTVYYWSIVPYNDEGDCATPSVWSFTTAYAVTAIATTPSPSDAATNVSYMAQLGWAAVANATSYDVYFGTTLPESPNATVTALTWNPGTLAYSTPYTWKVVPKNGFGATSGTPSVWTFTTHADPTITSYPYTEGFDGTTFPPIGWANYGVLKSNGSITANAFWTRVISGTYSSTTGAAKASYNYSSTAYACLQTPPINLPAAHGLSFYWKDADSKVTGHDVTYCEISTDGGATWTVLASLSAASSQSTYTQVQVDLNTYAGSGRLIRWRDDTDATYSAYGTFVDAIKIENIGTPPLAATTPTPADNAGNVSIYPTLSWVNGGGIPTLYKVYMDQTADPSNLIGSPTAATFTVTTPLAYNTTYKWKVVAHNDNGDATGNAVWTFTTMADPTVTSFPYVQNFESVTVPAMPGGWTVIDANADAKAWVSKTDGTNNKSASIVYNSSMAMDDWFFTPPVALTAGTAYEVKFSYRAESSTYAEALELKAGTAPNAAGMTNLLWSNTNILNTTHVAARGTFIPVTTGSYYFGWHGISLADMYNLYVDNIRITLPGTDVVTAYGTASSGSATIAVPQLINPITMTPFNTTVGITGITGAPTINVTAAWAPADVSFANAGLTFTLAPSTGFSLGGTTLTLTHNLGFVPLQLGYRILPSTAFMKVNNPGSWTTTQATLILPASKANGDVEVVFPELQDQELPVELTSFTATLTAEYFVNLAWTAQSETNHLGYNVLRSSDNNIDNALTINTQIIDNGTHSGTMTDYNYMDREVENETAYYYWLESVDLSGSSSFFGPLTVLVSNPDNPDTPFVVPTVTRLCNAFPNPFNPLTIISYDLKADSDVSIQVFNIKGQLIRTLVDAHRVAGHYQVAWNGTDDNGMTCASGIYFYRMDAGRYHQTNKVVMMK